MTDEELMKACEHLKQQVARGIVREVAEEVLLRISTKVMPPKPKAYRDMAKYMRDWRARKKALAEQEGNPFD